MLDSVVREQLETFLARARERERHVPRFVEREFPAFLACGILAHDMVRNDPTGARAKMTEVQIMKRVAQPDEIVGCALLLTSDAANVITGRVGFADGGTVPR